jgi:hypothetical protein
MILIYTPKATSRLHYAIKLVINQICGYDYTVTTSGEEFLNFKGARINYSSKEFPFDSVNILPSGFLLQKGIKDFTPPISTNGSLPLIFPNLNCPDCDIGFDIFSAAFFLTSRYEEYLPFLEDRYGRFEADQSLAYQKDFLEKPIIDIYAHQLVDLILEKFPFVEKPEKKYSFIPTYDIDVAYAYKGRGISRNFLAFTKDIFTFNFSNLNQRAQILLKLQEDPFDTYSYLFELQKKFKISPIYFFLAGTYSSYDKNISTNSLCFNVLLKMIGDYAETGIHPSFTSNYKKYQLKNEIKIVSGTLNRPVENSRQHFLKLHLPDTYQNLLDHGIKKDFSMGFASHPGFRAGTSNPYYFYNLATESETRLKVYPTTLMDGTLNDYLKLNPSDALDKAKSLIDEVKKVKGTFISLWHNDSLSEQGRWKGWRKMYEEMLKYATTI